MVQPPVRNILFSKVRDCSGQNWKGRGGCKVLSRKLQKLLTLYYVTFMFKFDSIQTNLHPPYISHLIRYWQCVVIIISIYIKQINESLYIQCWKVWDFLISCDLKCISYLNCVKRTLEAYNSGNIKYFNNLSQFQKKKI